MTPSEIAGIIGHELGHFGGQDIAYNLRFAPIYAHMGSVLQVASAVKGRIAIAFLPAQAVLGFFLQQFSYAERAIRRQREDEADAAGVLVASAPAFATALMKCAALAPLFQVVQNEVVALLGRGRMLPNVSLRFEAIARHYLTDTAASDIAQIAAPHRAPHPTDTHPPTLSRLQTIGVTLEEAAKNVMFPMDSLSR